MKINVFLKENALIRIKKIVLGFFILFLILPVSGNAQEEPFAKNGFYIGGMFPFNTIGGDFDGEMILVGGSDVILVPEVESGTGFGISLGLRSYQGAIELDYLRSRHDVKFLGIKFGEADYNMVNINGKYFFNMSQPAQPFLMAGMNIPWLVVENGSANATTVGDGFFYGVGLNLGGGLSYYFTPRIVLNLALIYRVIGYYTAEGVNGTRDEIKDPLFGGGLGINTGMAFTF